MRPAPLVVVVEDTRTGTRTRFAFLRSPVRVGRGPENDLSVAEPFVSVRHGVLQFDTDGVTYADLRSRNGSSLGGARLRSEEPVRVDPGSDLRLGPLRLVVSRGEPPPDRDEPVAPGALTELMERLARTPEPDAAEVAASRLHPGLVLGRFELVRELGRGGFGIVYEARDRQLGRRVAVKVIRPGERPARLGEAWLQREAEAAAQLGHPNIVTLHDVGSWEGGPYLVMELLRGEVLEARLARGPLPLPEALAIAVDVARAVAHAHAAGVVHRDLKPSNVFLVEDGYAKVLDFGLAHVFGTSAPLQGGTPGYMAPEQREGGVPDPRCDVYAAALVLEETLGGALPAPLAALVAQGRSAVPAGRPDARAWLEGLLTAQRAAAKDGPGAS